jgi:hypothetical protein
MSLTKLISPMKVTIGTLKAWNLYSHLKGERAWFFKDEDSLEFPN